MIYKVALSGNGRPGAVTTIPLSGDYQHVAGQFNLNGIVATADGKTLIAVQSFARKLFTIDPTTGVAKLIDLGGYDLSNGDGLLLRGRTLYVVQNRDNKVAVFELSRDLTTATFLRAITDPGNLDVPTTIDRAGEPALRRQRPLRDDDADRPGVPHRQAQLNVSSALSSSRAPAAHARRASAALEQRTAPRRKAPSVSTATALPSHR